MSKSPMGVQPVPSYDRLLAEIATVVQEARRSAARSVNAVMTRTYWLIGERIVEEEQRGEARAPYGEALISRLSTDLVRRFGRGFSGRNLRQMRAFYLAWPIWQAVPAKSRGAGSAEVPFPLPWAHYARLLQVQNPLARQFYEEEALRGGWSLRQLERQIGSQFFERTALSRDKAKTLAKRAHALPQDAMSPEEEIKNPYVLEFLNLKDEYSESDLEESLIRELETFLLELGGDFAFIGRQRRLRVGDAWFRVDLVLFHRRLRCLVVIDLKLEELSPSDVGQMHLYLNYARAHWTLPDENPPVGLILCTKKDHALAEYALDGLPNKVVAAEYRTVLPEERLLVEELERTRRRFEASNAVRPSRLETTP